MVKPKRLNSIFSILPEPLLPHCIDCCERVADDDASSSLLDPLSYSAATALTLDAADIAFIDLTASMSLGLGVGVFN